MTPSVPNQARRSVKLRNSCNGCTEAKMGCSKEKPTCARCERRGETCIYAPTKRAGRPGRGVTKSTSSNEDSTGRNQNVSDRSPSASSPSLPSAPRFQMVEPQAKEKRDVFGVTKARNPYNLPSQLGFIELPDLPDLLAGEELDPLKAFGSSGSTYDTHSTQFLPDFGSPSNPGKDSTIDIEHPIMGPVPYEDVLALDNSCSEEPSATANEGHSLNTLDALSQPCAGLNDPLNWIFSGTGEDTNAFPPAFGTDHEELPHANMAMQSAPADHSTPAAPPAHSCVSRSLVLLQQISPPTIECTQSSMLSTLPDRNIPTFQFIMEQNDRGIDAVLQMLDCPCSGQINTMHILCLIVSRILGWYAAASASSLNSPSEVPRAHSSTTSASGSGGSSASQSPIVHGLEQLVQPPSPSSLREYNGDFDDVDGGRIVCQQILSKLHKTQKAVGTLSKRLLAIKSRETSLSKHLPNRLASIASDFVSGVGFASSTSSVSSETLARNLEADLKSRMRELSQAIVETLDEWV